MTFDPDTRVSCSVRPAVNFGERAKHLPTDILLLHYTGMHSPEAAMEWLCCKESGVSCHYFVYEDGTVFQLVPESKRAWHAGKSFWQGETDINSRSIGIEIVNRGHNFDYPDYPEIQMQAVKDLCKDIIDRNGIPARNVLAHSDVAPDRKPDPGEKFPWKMLHANGIGHWVAEAMQDDSTVLQLGDNGEDVAALQALLQLYGYHQEITGDFDQSTLAVVVAFQRHFRPSLVDGMVDGQTRATLEKLIQGIGNGEM